MSAFILCRVFPFATDLFPVERFDDVPDEDYGSALVKLITELGPPDAVFVPAVKAERERQRQGQPSVPKHRRIEPGPKVVADDQAIALRAWVRLNLKRPKPVLGVFPDANDAWPIIQKMNMLNWFRERFYACAKIQSVAIAVAPSQEVGRDVVAALNLQFHAHSLRPRFLLRDAERMPGSERLLFEQEVDRQRELISENQLALFVESALDLIGRLGLPGAPVGILKRRAEQVRPTADTAERGGIKAKPVARKEPSREAFRAYRAYQFAGKPQKEIADQMRTNQGQVSKWVKAVGEWIKAGNILPDLGSSAKHISVDPAVIEMGEREDHRTKRQRLPSSEDDDSN